MRTRSCRILQLRSIFVSVVVYIYKYMVLFCCSQNVFLMRGVPPEHYFIPMAFGIALLL
jgi:hypothetical protein